MRGLLQQRNINLNSGNNSQTKEIFEYSGIGPLPNPIADLNYYILSNNGIGTVNIELPLSTNISFEQELYIVNIDNQQIINLKPQNGDNINGIVFPNSWLELEVNDATFIKNMKIINYGE